MSAHTIDPCAGQVPAAVRGRRRGADPGGHHARRGGAARGRGGAGPGTVQYITVQYSIVQWLLVQVLSPWIEGNTLAGDTGVQDTSLPDIVISLKGESLLYKDVYVYWSIPLTP